LPGLLAVTARPASGHTAEASQGDGVLDVCGGSRSQ